MAETLRDQSVYIGPYNLSSNINSVALQLARDPVDVTTLGDTFRKYIPGLRQGDLQYEGFHDTVDDRMTWLDTNLGLANVPCTIVGKQSAVGDPVYLFKAHQANLSPIKGAIGDASRISGAVQADSRVVRGTLLAKGTQTATGNGTIFQLGAIPTGDQLHAALHVTSVSGTSPTLTVKIQSASTLGFSSPIDRVTFTVVNGVITSEFKTLDGPITDAYWRVTWTISGTSPSYGFWVSAGTRVL